MGGREWEKMGRKRNGEGKKNGREEMGKSARVCVQVEEKKIKNGRRNEGVVVCVEKKKWGEGLTYLD